jgi:hypothetical protein
MIKFIINTLNSKIFFYTMGAKEPNGARSAQSLSAAARVSLFPPPTYFDTSVGGITYQGFYFMSRRDHVRGVGSI